jgi:nardilysin
MQLTLRSVCVDEQDALSDQYLAPERIVKLPDNTTVVLQARSTNAAEQNNAMELYFQHAPIDLMTSAIVDVIEQIMSEPAFNQLRTVEQLCYSLECGSRHTFGVQGYAVKLVSGTHSNKYLVQSALRFLDQFVAYLRDLSDETFQLHVQSTIKHKLQPPQNLHDATEHMWGEITIRRYAFHAELQQAEFLRTLSKDRLMAVFHELCTPTNPALRVLCCFVEGNSPDSKVQLKDEAHATPDSYLAPGRAQSVVVDDASKLATSCDLYPNFV